MSIDELAHKVGQRNKPAPIGEWETAATAISIPVRKLELIAESTRAPFGMLFLDEPPSEPIPISDFRRFANNSDARPSLNLLETIYEYQRRQDWLSEQLQEEGEPSLVFIGSVTIHTDILTVARDIRETLRIGTEERQQNRNDSSTVLWMKTRLEESGITVVRKGYAGTATKRLLNRAEFKGFALADQYAPYIFVNGKDWPASQIFTIAHECVHLWLGESAIPGGEWNSESAIPMEGFCNKVAAEVLVPAKELAEIWIESVSDIENIRNSAAHFKVSSLATLICARNSDLISRSRFDRTWKQLTADFESRDARVGKSGGGDYYNNAGVHLGKRFIREVLTRTMEGRTLYNEAFELLGTRKTSVLLQMAEKFLQE